MIIALSAWGIVTSKPLINMVLVVLNRPWGIYFAVAVRIGLGLVFILAADETRFPGVFRFLGYLMFIAAALILFIGRQKLGQFINWLIKNPPGMMRAWLVLGVAFGSFMVYGAN